MAWFEWIFIGIVITGIILCLYGRSYRMEAKTMYGGHSEILSVKMLHSRIMLISGALMSVAGTALTICFIS